MPCAKLDQRKDAVREVTRVRVFIYGAKRINISPLPKHWRAVAHFFDVMPYYIIEELNTVPVFYKLFSMSGPIYG